MTQAPPSGYAGQVDGVPFLPLEFWLWLGGICLAIVAAHHLAAWLARRSSKSEDGRNR